MDDVLPDDDKLVERKEGWEHLFKKFSTAKDDQEVSLDELTDALDGSLESEPEKENAPEAVEIEPKTTEEFPGESPRMINKKLQLAVKEREAVWKNKGINFTFDKVDEWLKASDYKNRKELVDPITGGHMIEQTHHKKMHVKRKYRGKGRSGCPDELKSSSEHDMDLSEDSSKSSVDTAQYIRANQNQRTSKITKTIIKKYIVTSVNHRHDRYKPILSRKQCLPLQAITNGRAKDVPKKKHRKTRHELNKRHRSLRDPSDYDDSSSSDVSDKSVPRTRKAPAAKLLKIQSDQMMHYHRPSLKKNELEHSQWVSEEDISSITSHQPKIILNNVPEKLLQDSSEPMARTFGRNISDQSKIILNNVAEESSQESSGPMRRSSAKRINAIPSTSTEKTTELPNIQGEVNETMEKDSVSSHSCSRTSSAFNMSRKSWANLPKTVVIYHPDLNTTNHERVRITNKHFEKAIGVEATKDFLEDIQFVKEISANAQLILERPTTEDELDSGEDSEKDPMDMLDVKKPKLVVVPMDNS